MANYSLVLDTRFKPFSYQEMLAPVAAATQAHQALEEEYGNLATKASVWEEMANEQTDPYAYRMYKNYSNDLASKADQLLKYGLNPASRKDMLGMRARYSKEIVPIENAYKRREELAAEQRKARASNPTLFFQRDMASTSLDDFIRNPSLDYGANYSGALLAQQAGQIASNLKNVLTGRSKLKGIGLPFQYEQLIQYGYTPEQIQEAVTNPKEGDPILTAIVDQVLVSSGMNRWATADQMMQARAYANQGLYNAIGKTDIKNFTDSYSMQNQLNRDQFNRQNAQNSGDKLKMWDINPTPLYGKSAISEMNNRYKEDLEQWKKKGWINEQGHLTKKGKEVYNKGEYVASRGVPSRSDLRPIDYSFRNTLVKLSSSPIRTVNDINNTIAGFLNDIASGDRLIGTPNIDVYRQSIKGKEMQDFVLGKITSSAGNLGVYEAGRLVQDSDGNMSLQKGNPISIKKLKEKAKEYPLTFIANVPGANEQIFEMADGAMYILPKGVLSSINEANLNLVGDINDPNSHMGINQKLRYATSDKEIATLLNKGNSYLGSILDWNEGTGIKPSDGTIMIR